MALLSKLLRVGEDRPLKALETLLGQVNGLEPTVEQLSDGDLAAKTGEFRSRLAVGEPMDQLVAESFAVVREAAKRILCQRHFDVQVIGAGALHRGMVVEMRTGEGKTLVSTMPAYLNSLGGSGVHLVTVNDYLSARDAAWMGGIYRFLGISVGLLQNDDGFARRQAAYQADVTYGTNQEFGFDYLRDNMSMTDGSRVQRRLVYAIVDEADSILVDEARVPLVVSGRGGETAKWYREFADLVHGLKEGIHYEVDYGRRQVLTTEEGVYQVEAWLGIPNMYEHTALDMVHHLEQALRAKELYRLDVDYLVTGEDEVLIVDEFTGRVRPGRRYSGGLHQAIEAKEHVRIKEENQTLATVTLQKFFRLYEKLAGMTGTALTEAAEFSEVYGLDVVEIPTNVQVVRNDLQDVIYKTKEDKYRALVKDVERRHEADQPVLIGTTSIEKSERISRMLERHGISHQVLNAKHHAREAGTIAQAGSPGAVTVATNMAGRGVDIQLGGNAAWIVAEELRKRTKPEPGSCAYAAEHERLLAEYACRTVKARQKVLDAGGVVCGRYRTARQSPDRQSAARTVWSAGRPRRVPVLPVVGG